MNTLHIKTFSLERLAMVMGVKSKRLIVVLETLKGSLLSVTGPSAPARRSASIPKWLVNYL
jgi:hypothetical protein